MAPRTLIGLLLLFGLGGGIGGEPAGAHYIKLDRELVEPGSLIVGLGLSGRPFAYRQDGKLLGFEVDIAQAVADAHGLKLKIAQLPRAELIGALERGEVDAINTLPIRDDADNLAILPYLTVGDHMLVLKGNPFRVEDKDSLAGRTVAVTEGSTAEIFARSLSDELEAAGKSGMSIHSFPNFRHTHIPVSMGHAAAYFVHTVSAIAVNRDPDSRVMLVEGVFRASREVGFAVDPAHQDLYHAIEHAIAAAVATGKYEKLLAASGLPADLSPYRK